MKHVFWETRHWQTEQQQVLLDASPLVANEQRKECQIMSFLYVINN